MTNKVFAPGIERTPEGWYNWGRDTDLRRRLFVEEAMWHPAKADINMLMDIVEYISTEGEVLLDPFGGIGSLMVATTIGRHVITIELQEGYHQLQLRTWNEILKDGAIGRFMALRGDTRLLLPIPCDHVITSPPYSNVLATPNERLMGQAAVEKGGMSYQALYQEKDPANFGAMPIFQYNQMMERIYRGMVQSVRVGGTITIIIKDITKDGKRVYLSSWVERSMKQLGLESYGWFKRKAHGIASDVRKSQGLDAIEDEDIMVYRRVK